MYKRYYSPFEEKPVRREMEAEIIKPQKLSGESEKKSQKRDFFSKISNDDIILIGILLLLLMEDKENRDIPLVLGIGFLLLIDYIEKD